MYKTMDSDTITVGELGVRFPLQRRRASTPREEHADGVFVRSRALRADLTEQVVSARRWHPQHWR